MNVKSLSLAFAAFASVAAISTAASAGSLSAQYFAITNPGDPYLPAGSGDFAVCCSTDQGATLPVIGLGDGLGPKGMPVTAADGANTVVDQDMNGQILWWTDGADGIAATGTGSFTLGKLNNMFAQNSDGSNDTNAFETAILSGKLIDNGADAKITVGSDDDALVYVDGLYVGGEPGVHSTAYTTIDLGSFTGTKSLEIFYADRSVVGANLEVDVAGASVPEPATWAIMMLGFGGLGVAMRSRRRQAAATV